MPEVKFGRRWSQKRAIFSSFNTTVAAFGAYLQSRREKFGFDQQQAADRASVGLNYPDVSAIERGNWDSFTDEQLAGYAKAIAAGDSPVRTVQFMRALQQAAAALEAAL